MSKPNKLVFGLGLNNGKYHSCFDKEALYEYKTWKNMLRRCTQKYWSKHPTYIGITCSENFRSYGYFYEWCQTQIGFGVADKNGKSWCLDKDILVKRNKIYSEDTCVFVPHRINSLLIKRDASRGEWPVGVYWNERDKKFRSQCSDGMGLRKQIGSYDTPQEAFTAYKEFKEALIKQVAEEYKHQLDYRVYAALINYEVNIND